MKLSTVLMVFAFFIMIDAAITLLIAHSEKSYAEAHMRYLDT